VIDEFLTVSLYQPNEFIARKMVITMYACFDVKCDKPH